MNAKNINNVRDALHALGVTESTLSQDEKQSMTEKGYVVFHQELSGEAVNNLSKRFETLMSQTGYQTGRMVEEHEANIADIIKKQFKQEGYSKSKPVNELRNLVNEGAMFDVLYTDPRLLASVTHVTGGEACKLSHLSARELLPDASVDRQQGRDAIVNALWLLDDYTEENGALTVASGSHKTTDLSGCVEIPLYAPAGTLIVLDSRLLRRESLNRSGQNKRMITVDFIGPTQPQKLNQWEFIRKTTYDRISEAAKYILEV